MATAPFVFAPQPQVAANVAVAPAQNVLTSMAALNAVAHLEDIDAWLAATAATLTPEQLRVNRLVFELLGDALIPEREANDFADYLASLQHTRPAKVRDRALERLTAPIAASTAAPDELLGSLQAYRAQLARTYPDVAFDEQLVREAHALLNDPPRLHELLVAHLESLWETWFQAEWRRTEPVLNMLTRQLVQRFVPSGTPPEVIRAFTGRELPPSVAAQLDGVRTVVFVLSPHVGSIASRFASADTIYVFVRALDQAEGTQLSRRIAVGRLPLRQAPIKPVELVGPFTALADETRLQILRLLANHGDLLAQEIIAQMPLSQSSISRHLKLLVSTGLIQERRAEGANKRYRLDPARIDWIYLALRRVLAVDTSAAAPTVRDEQPLELRRFLDAEGRVVTWPARQRDRDMVLQYLRSHFERGREYEEREVNEILSRWDKSLDPATLRRKMFDLRLLARTVDGRRYWVPEDYPFAPS